MVGVGKGPLLEYQGKDVLGRVSRGSGVLLTALRSYVPAVMFAVLLVLIWEGFVRLFSISSFILPAPSEITSTIVARHGQLFHHTLVTGHELLVGFAFGNALAVIFAIVIASSRLAERTILPLFVGSQTIPKIAIAPLFVVWFGAGTLSKIIITAVVCFFPTVINTVQGLKSVDPDAVDLMRSVSASRRQVFLKLRFPNALPYFLAGLKVSIALATIGAVISEWVGASEGLGYLVLYSTQTLRTTLLFAALVFISALGIFLYLMVVLLERLVSWE